MIVLANERTKVVIYPVTAKSLVEIFAFCGVAIMNAGSTGKCKISDLFEELGFRV